MNDIIKIILYALGGFVAFMILLYIISLLTRVIAKSIYTVRIEHINDILRKMNNFMGKDSIKSKK